MNAIGIPEKGVIDSSLIHFIHFRYWRLHGVAFEFRDSVYNFPNKTLLVAVNCRT